MDLVQIAVGSSLSLLLFLLKNSAIFTIIFLTVTLPQSLTSVYSLPDLLEWTEEHQQCILRLYDLNSASLLSASQVQCSDAAYVSYFRALILHPQQTLLALPYQHISTVYPSPSQQARYFDLLESLTASIFDVYRETDSARKLFTTSSYSISHSNRNANGRSHRTRRLQKKSDIHNDNHNGGSGSNSNSNKNGNIIRVFPLLFPVVPAASVHYQVPPKANYIFPANSKLMKNKGLKESSVREEQWQMLQDSLFTPLYNNNNTYSYDSSNKKKNCEPVSAQLNEAEARLVLSLAAGTLPVFGWLDGPKTDPSYGTTDHEAVSVSVCLSHTIDHSTGNSYSNSKTNSKGVNSNNKETEYRRMQRLVPQTLLQQAATLLFPPLLAHHLQHVTSTSTSTNQTTVDNPILITSDVHYKNENKLLDYNQLDRRLYTAALMALQQFTRSQLTSQSFANHLLHLSASSRSGSSHNSNYHQGIVAEQEGMPNRMIIFSLSTPLFSVDTTTGSRTTEKKDTDIVATALLHGLYDIFQPVLRLGARSFDGNGPNTIANNNFSVCMTGSPTEASYENERVKEVLVYPSEAFAAILPALITKEKYQPSSQSSNPSTHRSEFWGIDELHRRYERHALPPVLSLSPSDRKCLFESRNKRNHIVHREENSNIKESETKDMNTSGKDEDILKIARFNEIAAMKYLMDKFVSETNNMKKISHQKVTIVLSLSSAVFGQSNEKLVELVMELLAHVCHSSSKNFSGLYYRMVLLLHSFNDSEGRSGDHVSNSQTKQLRHLEKLLSLHLASCMPSISLFVV